MWRLLESSQVRCAYQAVSFCVCVCRGNGIGLVHGAVCTESFARSPPPTLVHPGRYFAGASMYMGASVKINPGPDFKFPPDGYSVGLVRPLSQVTSMPTEM